MSGASRAAHSALRVFGDHVDGVRGIAAVHTKHLVLDPLNPLNQELAADRFYLNPNGMIGDLDGGHAANLPDLANCPRNSCHTLGLSPTPRPQRTVLDMTIQSDASAPSLWYDLVSKFVLVYQAHTRCARTK